VPNNPPADLMLTPLQGDGKTISEWLTIFNLLSVVVDPFANESAWILGTADRVLRDLRGAGVRVNWIVAGDADETRAFLGPLADEHLTFADPERRFVKAVGLERLPAIVYILGDVSVEASAEGWDAKAWRDVLRRVATVESWVVPAIPLATDPQPYEGSPALV
jgi:hypothetical protein